MKRKKIFILIALLLITLTSGCDNKDELKNSNILTTIYPVEYIVSRLYEDSNISSIYPNETKINDYELTDKQIKTYAKESNIFVYTGLSKEKDIAKKLYDKNDDLQMIDASYSVKLKYGIEELWLNPNNYLMLASTIKNDLQTISNNKYTNENIEKKFKELEEELAILDANLRSIGKRAIANNTSTLIISYDTFAYLEEYGFTIVNISNENNVTSTLKTNFKNQTYKYILIKDSKNVPDYIQDLVDNYGTTLIEVPNLETLTDKQRENKENYITIIRDFINKLSDITTPPVE